MPGSERCFLVLAEVVCAEETAEQVQSLRSCCLAVRTDISSEADVTHLVEQSVSKFTNVDTLVNNSAICQLNYTPTQGLPVVERDNIIRTNLTGTFLCCKYLGKEMIESSGGTIVKICTTAGTNGVPRAPDYSASKAGVIPLAKSLALEWAQHNIRVSAAAAHYLETGLAKGLRNSEKVCRSLIKQITVKRFGKTSEILGAVLPAVLEYFELHDRINYRCRWRIGSH